MLLFKIGCNCSFDPFNLEIFIDHIQFSHWVMYDSFWPHELQHARPPCPLPTPRVHPNPCPLSRWWHPTISSSVIPFSSCHQSFPASGFFSNESALRIRWPKYWNFSFNISPSIELPGLISFRMDLLGSPCSPRDSQESYLTPQFKSISSSALSFLYSPTLTGKTIALTRWTFVGKVMSLLF